MESVNEIQIEIQIKYKPYLILSFSRKTEDKNVVKKKSTIT